MRNKNDLRRKLNIVKYISFIIICFWMFLLPLAAEAEEAVKEETMQLVILLDGSQSMRKVDGQYLIKDFILEIAAITPENCRIGAAVYQDELCFLLPPGSDYDEIEKNLKKIEYTGYGNAGEGLEQALALLQEGNGERKILLISDGEIMMRTEAQTTESVEAFAQAAEKAKEENITIDIVALGKSIEEGNTVYAAAGSTGGQIYELSDSSGLADFARRGFLEGQQRQKSHVGSMNGTDGELSVKLPDEKLEQAVIYLLGEQDNENLTINGKAAEISLQKGEKYTVIKMEKPEPGEVGIQMVSTKPMDINAYLTVEYELVLSALALEPGGIFKSFSGDIVRIPEITPEQPDWFFWGVIIVFVLAIAGLFLVYIRSKGRRPVRKKMIDERRMLPKENGMRGNDFCGKLVVYVIHDREEIDYPPESINLFARCNREVITLEWILDICNLPLQLKGAEKIMIRPGDDRSIVVKNNGRAAAMKGRELLIKGHAYHLYYQEKITFIFDEEDTEIEVHYKALKPNER